VNLKHHRHITLAARAASQEECVGVLTVGSGVPLGARAGAGTGGDHCRGLPPIHAAPSSRNRGVVRFDPRAWALSLGRAGMEIRRALLPASSAVGQARHGSPRRCGTLALTGTGHRRDRGLSPVHHTKVKRAAATERRRNECPSSRTMRGAWRDRCDLGARGFRHAARVRGQPRPIRDALRAMAWRKASRFVSRPGRDGAR